MRQCIIVPLCFLLLLLPADGASGKSNTSAKQANTQPQQPRTQHVVASSNSHASLLASPCHGITSSTEKEAAALSAALRNVSAFVRLQSKVHAWSVKECQHAAASRRQADADAKPTIDVNLLTARLQAVAELNGRVDAEVVKQTADELLRTADAGANTFETLHIGQLARKHRGYSSKADTLGGSIRISASNVTKRFMPIRGVSPSTTTVLTMQYYAEKIALCRLERCAKPCGVLGRKHYFPRLLRHSDSARSLMMSFEGQALATDVGSLHHVLTLEEANLTPSLWLEQLRCMREQLTRARVVHLDVACKNIYFRPVRARNGTRSFTTGLLTMGDLDNSQTDANSSSYQRKERSSANMVVWKKIGNQTKGCLSDHTSRRRPG